MRTRKSMTTERHLAAADHASSSDLAAALFKRPVDELIATLAGIDAVRSDPERVHRARVATRRLRSSLRTFRPLVDQRLVRQLLPELGWLGSALGAVRDREALLACLMDMAAKLPRNDQAAAKALLGRLEAERDEKQAELLIVLESDRARALLEALRAAAEQLVLTGAGDPSMLGSLVKPEWRRLKRAVRSLPARASDKQLHRVRILAKRCRYAAEAVAPMLSRSVAGFAAACQHVQDVLGAHQDCVLGQQWLRRNAEAASSPEAFAAGQLVMLEGQAAAAARAAWPAAWKALDKKRLRRWLGGKPTRTDTVGPA
jgi:CHAD domain-containing protein